MNAYASRAPRPPGAVVCRDADVARERFGVDTEETGAIYTRTGRAFLDGREQTEAALARVRAAADAAGLWEALDTGWLVLDCELLPWSAKAMQLIRRQYAAVGAAARAGLSSSIKTLERAAARGLDVAALLDHERRRHEHVLRYAEAYRRYAWPVEGIDDLRLAPFHVLAAQSGVFVDRGHDWHLELCDRLVDAGAGWLQRTERLVVDVTDAGSQGAGVAWWEALTAGGGEGMVVKAGRPRVRPRRRGAGALRRSGAAASPPRMRLRGARDGDRPRGPEAVAGVPFVSVG